MRLFYPPIYNWTKKSKWHLQEGSTGRAACCEAQLATGTPKPWVDEGQCEAAIPAHICRRCLQKL